MNRIWQTIAISQWCLKIQWNSIIVTQKFFHKGNWFQRARLAAKSWEFSSRWPTRKGLCLHVKFSRRFFKILKFNLSKQKPIAAQIHFHVTCYWGNNTIFNTASEGRIPEFTNSIVFDWNLWSWLKLYKRKGKISSCFRFEKYDGFFFFFLNLNRFHLYYFAFLADSEAPGSSMLVSVRSKYKSVRKKSLF